MWTVLRIDEADYGCEERMPGEPTMVLVTLISETGETVCFECAENWIEFQEIEEGDEWPEELLADQEQQIKRADEMTAWMNHYYELMGDKGDGC